MRFALLLAASQALAPDSSHHSTISVKAGGVAEPATFARRHPTGHPAALVETQLAATEQKSTPGDVAPTIKATVQSPTAGTPRMRPWLSPYILDAKKECVKTRSCEKCPSATGDVTDPKKLEKCEPAFKTHEEVLDSITDAAAQCNGKTVLSSKIINERAFPPRTAKFVCTKCEQKAGMTLITILNAEAKPECEKCSPSCQDSCTDPTKKSECKCKEGAECDEAVCLGKCCTEEAWVDLTEGGKVVPQGGTAIYTLTETKAIKGCEGGAAPLFALAMLLLTAW